MGTADWVDQWCENVAAHMILFHPHMTNRQCREYPQDEDGRPLGTHDEERLADEDRARAEELGDMPGSSTDTPATTVPPTVEQEVPEPDIIAESATDATRQGRRTSHDRRTPPRLTTTALGPALHQDWTHFDIGQAMRALRSDSEGVIRRVLRKLHVMWWHASSATMQRFLHHDGVCKKTLDLIPQITISCAVCRE